MACSGTSNQDTVVHSGDDARLVVNFVDCAGAPVAVTGSTLTYTIHELSDSDALLTLLSPTQIVIADDGKSAAIYLPHANTALGDAEYFHKLVLTDSAGHILTTLTGTIQFSTLALTSCAPLTARVDTGLFVSGGPSYMLDFTFAENARNFHIFLMR